MIMVEILVDNYDSLLAVRYDLPTLGYSPVSVFHIQQLYIQVYGT